MNKVLGWIPKFVAYVTDSIPAVRKAVVAAAAHAALLASLFTFVFPQTSVLHASAITTATALLVGFGTWFTPNANASP
jgi:hypothetical protein